MSAFAMRSTLRITDPDPFGEVTLAPAAVTGRSESELAQSMAALNSERQNLQERLAQSKRSDPPNREALYKRWSEISGKTLALLKSGADTSLVCEQNCRNGSKRSA